MVRVYLKVFVIFTVSNMNSEYLKNFYKYSYHEKLSIIKKGRPKPEMEELKQKKGNVIRKFQASWYDEKEWLCGCVLTNRLFCFSCLLFSVYGDNVWTKKGYYDLNNLPTAVKKHEKTIAHYQSQISLKTFGSTRGDSSIDNQKKISNETHNKKVKENRKILKKLISASCFLIKQELPFRGNNESKNSLNRGNYIELLKFTSNFDEKLAHHLETSSVFSGISNSIQNDIIEAVSVVVERNIAEEISRAPFIAIEVDEITDISNAAQCSLVLRYLLNFEIKEAFLGFKELKDRTAAGLTECIFETLDKYKCTEKLIAQAYDGASVMTSHLYDVQAKVKEKAPSALFTHCYAHNLNHVLSQSGKFIPECTIFFKTIEALASFFSYSTKLTKMLNEIVDKHTPKPAPIRWTSNLKLVQTILLYHSDLCQLFDCIMNSPLTWDSDTLVKSTGFHSWLTKDSTYFLLIVYDIIFSKTEVLFNTLQTKIMDIHYCIERINQTVNSLKDIRQNFKIIEEKFQKDCKAKNIIKSKFSGIDSQKDERERIFRIILDDVLNHMKTRYCDFQNLSFLSLADCKIFLTLANQLDDDTAFEYLEKNYGNFFDITRLKSDLSGIYNSKVFQKKTCREMLAFIFRNELEVTFPEVVKFFQLILTIPIKTVPVQKSISALKRIKNYARNRMKTERLSSLALVSIEKERFTKIEQDSTYDFYEKVIDVFATQKERRIDFLTNNMEDSEQIGSGNKDGKKRKRRNSGLQESESSEKSDPSQIPRKKKGKNKGTIRNSSQFQESSSGNISSQNIHDRLRPLSDEELMRSQGCVSVSEFDFFGESVSKRLNRMPRNGALQLRLKIEQLVTDFRQRRPINTPNISSETPSLCDENFVDFKIEVKEEPFE